MSGAPSKCLLWFNGQKFDHCTCYGAPGVNHDIPHTSLKTNGQGNPFVVSPAWGSGRSIPKLIFFNSHKVSLAQIEKRLFDLFSGIHDERAISGDRFVEWFAGYP
jgi:hypothetical protein